MNGIWTLKVTDFQALDNGVLENWSLAFPVSCYRVLQTLTPDITSLQWSTAAANPQPSVQNTISSTVSDPGPDPCQTPGTCIGNSLTASTSVGPFNSAGTYTYTLTGVDEFGCSYSLNIVINATCGACPTATLSYAGPYCASNTFNQLPTLTGTGSYTSGIYSAPAGLSINASTGSISPSTSTPGTYLVTYTIAAAGSCSAVTTTATVTINAKPTAPVIGTITQPTCTVATGSVALSGLPSSGNWTITSSPSGSLSGSGTTGTVTGLTAGTTYTFTVTNASGCTSVASSSAVVNAQPTTPATTKVFHE